MRYLSSRHNEIHQSTLKKMNKIKEKIQKTTHRRTLKTPHIHNSFSSSSFGNAELALRGLVKDTSERWRGRLMSSELTSETSESGELMSLI